MLANLVDEKKFSSVAVARPLTVNCSPQVRRTPVTGPNTRIYLVSRLEYYCPKRKHVLDTKILSTLVSELPNQKAEKPSPLPHFFRQEDHRYTVARAKIQAQNLEMQLVSRELRGVSVIIRPHIGKKQQEKLLLRAHKAGLHNIPNEKCSVCSTELEKLKSSV